MISNHPTQSYPIPSKINSFEWNKQVSNALWPFLLKKLEIEKLKLQVSFSLGSFVSDDNIWNALSFTYLGASWLQAHKPANLHQDQ